MDHHLRHGAGQPTGGQFATARHDTDTGVDLSTSGMPRCPVCGRFRGRAVDHRCPAPMLVPLTPAASAVIAAIDDAGGRALLVGGCVRDAVLGGFSGRIVAPKDIDIEAYGLNQDQLTAALRGTGGRVDEVGVSFGVTKVAFGDEDFDVSLPRRDSKVGDGHRGFAVEVDHALTEIDACGRRDFTINSMAWDPRTGHLVDPYAGAADLRDRVLRHTTDAFADDPLRVLRGVQFAGRFDMTLDPQTADVCRGLSDRFGELSTERVWGEFAKIATMAPYPSKALNALHEAGWEHHFPALAACRDVPQDPHWHPEGPVHVHLGMAADAAAAEADRLGLDAHDRTIVVLGAMAHDFGKATHTDLGGPDGRITSHGHAEAGVAPAQEFLHAIGAPHRYVEKIAPIVREHMAVAGTGGADPTPTAVRRMIRRLAEPNGRGPGLRLWAAVVAADHAGRGPASGPNPAQAWLRVADRLGESPDRPRGGLLTGKHLIDAGMKPGPAFRPILDEALRAQDDGEFTDEAGAMMWLTRHRSTMAP